MAAKKKTAKKKVSKKKTSNKKSLMSMDDYEAQLAQEAEELSSRIDTSAEFPMISIKNKEFSVGDADLGEEMDVVIIEVVNEKAYYDGSYDEDNPSTPACFAVGICKPNELVPSEDSPKLQDEGEGCGKCWGNEWKSADTGKGKACKDVRRLACIHVSDLETNVDDIEWALLKTPPTSSGPFDKFFNGLKRVHKRPPWGFIVHLSFDEEISYPVINFSGARKIDNVSHMQVINALRERIKDSDILTQGYDASGYVDPDDRPAPAKSKKKTSKKKTGKKKTAKKKSRFS